MSTNGFFKLINTIIEINTQTDVLKSRRGQRKNLISRRTIDLPNAEKQRKYGLKLNTVSEISETLIIELTFASLKSR